MKNPYVFALVAFALLVGGFFVTNNNWFKNFISSLFPAYNKGNNNGNGNGNGYGNGNGDLPIDANSIERTIKGTDPIRIHKGTGDVYDRTGKIGNVNDRAWYNLLVKMTAGNDIPGTVLGQYFPFSLKGGCAPGFYNSNFDFNFTYEDGRYCYYNRVGKSTGAKQGTSAPSIILLPVSSKCVTYTSKNPYSSNGCSYVFGGYINDKGVRMCQLKKISCP